RRGEALPLTSLSSDQYENLMYGCIGALRDRLGLDIVQGPGESSDAGFDVTAKRRRDQALACVQAKRLSDAFHLSMFGPELAKVALKSRIEGSQVLEHRLITAGTVGETLRSALRENSR